MNSYRPTERPIHSQVRNRKDLKCVRRRRRRRRRRRPCQLIPMYVHYYVNTVHYYFTR
jgi:hypothetical protein